MQYAFKHWTLLFGSLFLLLAGQGAYAQCFQIESILVDACDGSNEGQNEMLTFRVGATALNTANLTATWPNNPWQGICQNSTTAAAIATINATIQGCGKLIEPTGGVLPANSKVLIITSTAFNPLAHSFVNLNDTMYVIFQCAGNTSGHFANYGSGTRTTTLSFSTPSPCSDVVTYDRGQLLNQSMMPGAQDGATVLFDPAGVATYTNNGCQAPYIPLSVDAGPNKSVCSNAALTLNATASGHYTSVLWSGGTGSFSPANSLATTYAPGPGDVGTIKLYCKAIAACGNNTVTTKDSMTVQILVAPQASAMASLSSICNGQTSVLSYSLTNAASAGTVTPTWYPQGVSTATAAATSPGNYTLSIANACGSSMATVSVSPGPTPTVAITANGPTQFCQGGNVILTGSSSSGYSWSTGATTSTISVSTTTTVTLTASNSCGSTSATQTVAVMPTLTVAVTPTNYTLCPGQTTTLSATSNGTAFDWGTATTPTLAVSNAGVTP